MGYEISIDRFPDRPHLRLPSGCDGRLLLRGPARMIAAAAEQLVGHPTTIT
jgi:hypothetical protein